MLQMVLIAITVSNKRTSQLDGFWKQREESGRMTMRRALIFTFPAAYRGHRVRRDHEPQRRRCHPEAAGKTTKEDQVG